MKRLIICTLLVAGAFAQVPDKNLTTALNGMQTSVSNMLSAYNALKVQNKNQADQIVALTIELQQYHENKLACPTCQDALSVTLRNKTGNFVPFILCCSTEVNHPVDPNSSVIYIVHGPEVK